VSLFAVIALTLLVGPASAQPVASDAIITDVRTTQQVDLTPGPNVVSLYVVPDEPQMEALFSGLGENLRSVKDPSGTQSASVFMPSRGIRDLSVWDWRTSYVVDVSQATSLEVSGFQIDPASAIPVELGWNYLPYLHDRPMAADSALASIVDAVDWSGSAGEVRLASGDESTVTVLEPGRGYRVYAVEPDTLVYAEAIGGGPEAVPADYTVATIADAVSLRGLVPGQTVRVEDPLRGGLFEVTESGAPSDGGTVFVPTEHTEETTAGGLGGSQALYDGPDDEGIVFDSFRLYYGDGADDYLTAVHLHGHGTRSEPPLIGVAPGRLVVPNSLRQYAKARTGSDRLRATYRYATSDLRLERAPVSLVLEGLPTTRYVRPEWWGARPYPTSWQPDTSPPPTPGAPPSGIVRDDALYDATDELASAMNAASASAVRTDEEHYVVLRGMYGYSRVLEVQESAVVKGELDRVRDGQGLRVMKGAPWHKWALESHTDPAYAEPATPADALVGDPIVTVRHGRGARVSRVVDVEIDGNIVENAYVFTDEYTRASGRREGSHWDSFVEDRLQNSTHWNGFVASHQYNDNVEGANPRLQNVHIHDTGGNIILGGNAPSTHFGGSRDLRLGNSARNHVMYSVRTDVEGRHGPPSFIDRIEVYGFWWEGAIPFQMGGYREVSVAAPVPNPYFGTLNNFFGHRNTNTDPTAIGNPESDYYFGETGVVEGLRVEPEPGAEFVAAAYAKGPLQISGLEVAAADPDLRVKVFKELGDSGVQTDRSHFVLTDAAVESGRAWNFMGSSATRGDVRGLTVSSPHSPGRSYAGFLLRPGARQHVYTVYDVQPGTGMEPYASAEVFKIWPRSSEPESAMDLFVQRVTLDTPRSVVHVAGLDPEDPAVRERYRVYFRDATFNAFRLSNNDAGTTRYGYKLCYFDRVVVGGKLSEDAGQLDGARLTAAGNGTGTIDVEPRLWYRPYEAEDGGGGLVSVTGADADRYLGYENVGTPTAPVLRLRFEGTAPVSALWSAAVRPIPPGTAFPE
jgi:hypothetical protein